MLSGDLDSLSLGTTLRIKQRVKAVNSCQKSDLLFDSTDYQCNKYCDINNEERDKCQNDSVCEHGQLQTCCSGYKNTQENSCNLLNLTTYNSTGDVGQNGGKDVRLEKITANTPENRIHKSNGFRQDIPGPSISLSVCNKQVNKTDKLKAIRSTELQCEKQSTIMATQQNPLLLKQGEQHKHVYDQGRGFRCKVFEDETSSLKIITPADVECVSHQHEVTSCCHAAGEFIYNTIYSHFREVCSDQLKSEPTQSAILKQRAQDNVCVTDDTTFKDWLYINNNYAKQIRQKNAYVCSSGDPSRLDKINSECCKDNEKPICHGNSGSNKSNDDENFYSRKHLAVLIYNLSAAVIVLALIVMYLYVKINSLEASRDVFIAQCQCGEKQPMFWDKQILGRTTDKVRTTNNKLTALPSTFTSFMMTIQEKTYQRSDDNIDTSDTGVQHPPVSQKSTSYKRIIVADMSPTKDGDIASDTDTIQKTTSSQDASSPEVTQVSGMLTSAGASRFENADKDHPAVLSRVVRSASEKHSGSSISKEWKKQRKNFCKHFNKDCKTQTDTFEGHFSRIINYNKHLTEKECTSYEKWDPDIKACRNQTIFFPRQYSVLPFYLETNDTADKPQNKRLVVIDNAGRFHIQKQGKYLIHVNNVVVDPNGTHFLAVYLNNMAVLACPDGGFRCPATNEVSSIKYRICNIIGVLNCNKDDIVDIRTMEANMRVRLETTKKSIFNFVSLN